MRLFDLKETITEGTASGFVTPFSLGIQESVLQSLSHPKTVILGSSVLIPLMHTT
jgi:hypothetical protein